MFSDRKTCKTAYIIVSVIIILALNVTMLMIEINCLTRPVIGEFHEIGPVSISGAVSAIDAAATKCISFPDVAAYMNSRSSRGISSDVFVQALRNTVVIMAVPNGLMISLAVVMYNYSSSKKDGDIERARSYRGGIIAIVIMSVFGVLIVYSLSTYLGRAKNAASSVRAHAPVVYMYGDDEEVNLRLDLEGELTAAYPRYVGDEGWTVTASSDGNLTDSFGNEFDFIYWEADLLLDCDFSRGFCIPGEDTEEFLYEAAYELGLNETEASAFVGYWTPVMKDNTYNVISFQTTTFDEAARMIISPEPDVLVRVNMLWYPSDTYVAIAEQSLPDISVPLCDRHGLTVVEWGGEMYGNGN
ncbi:MAG: hypothetical protein J5685_02895 [Clostridiales bacterium]|nr:hypothetical protein [Clostridiales bacterium]